MRWHHRPAASAATVPDDKAPGFSDPTARCPKARAIALPSLRQQDKTTGDINGTSVSYKFSISVNGGAYSDVVVDGDSTLTITGKTIAELGAQFLTDPVRVSSTEELGGFFTVPKVVE